jgi:hypothetical protein
VLPEPTCTPWLPVTLTVGTSPGGSCSDIFPSRGRRFGISQYARNSSRCALSRHRRFVPAQMDLARMRSVVLDDRGNIEGRRWQQVSHPGRLGHPR